MIVQTLTVHIWSTCILLYMVTVLGVSYLVLCTVYWKPGKYFLARGPVRLGVPRAPMQVKTALEEPVDPMNVIRPRSQGGSSDTTSGYQHCSNLLRYEMLF